VVAQTGVRAAQPSNRIQPPHPAHRVRHSEPGAFDSSPDHLTAILVFPEPSV
jgi:hypothetical protein